MIIEIDGAYSGIRFSACHFIQCHEKCSRLHGHSYIVRARLTGDIGESGMLMDFVEIKRALRKIADSMDHKTLLPRSGDNIKLSVTDKEVEITSYGKRYLFPREDVVLLNIDTTTAEEMARLMVADIRTSVTFPTNVRSIAVGLDEERGQTAWYEEIL